MRAVHRPVSITVESISRLPDVRELPSETELTVNLKLSQTMARELVSFLQKELEKSIDLIAVTVTGISR